MRRESRGQSDHPKDKHGAATYPAAAMGTTDDKIRVQFAPYIERFAAYLQ